MRLKPLVIVGVGIDGIDGLSRKAQEWITRADELWGGERLLALWPDHLAKKVTLGKQLATQLQNLKQRAEDEQVVLLASGDPGFFGLSASLLKVLPPEEMVFCPQVSILQAAYARIGLPWNDAAFTSAHGRSAAEVIGLAGVTQN